MPVVRQSDDNYGRASGDVKKIISAERNNPDRAAAMCVEVGTKRLSGRVSYRKARGILRHVGESKGKSTLIIYGAGQTDFVYYIPDLVLSEIFSRLEHDNNVNFLRVRVR